MAVVYLLSHLSSLLCGSCVAQKPSQSFDCPCCPCLSLLQFYHFIFERERPEVHRVFKLYMPQGFITVRWWQNNVSLLFCFILLSLESLTFNFFFFFFLCYWMNVFCSCFHRVNHQNPKILFLGSNGQLMIHATLRFLSHVHYFTFIYGN